MNPVPANVTRVHTAAWGTSEPSNIPQVCRVEFFWQAIPGELLDDVDRQFLTWFQSVVASQPHVFALEPQIEHPIRWLPGSALSADHPLTAGLASAATEVLGNAPLVQGIEGPVFHEFGIPAVLWGARATLHNPDEYVEIDSVLDAAAVLLEFVCRWCGVASSS